jgi:type II secretory pathway pseudopilin PulG
MNYWRNNRQKGFLTNENGMTLVELLASILLLSLIISTFLSFFIQAAKVNNETNAVNEATFIAQEQIEMLTYYANTKTVDETLGLMETESNGYEIVSNLLKESDGTLYKGTVEVWKGETRYARMETRLSFRTEENPEE